MDSFEINKIIAAVIITVLIVLGIGKGSENILLIKAGIIKKILIIFNGNEIFLFFLKIDVKQSKIYL